MGRVVAIGPGGKPQAPARTDNFRDLIDLMRQHGLLDQLRLSPQVYASWEEADEVRRGLLLSARYYCSCGRTSCTRRYKNYPTEKNPAGGCPYGGQRITGRADVVKDSRGRLRVQWVFHDKRESVRHHLQKRGLDRSTWPYDPQAKRMAA